MYTIVYQQQGNHKLYTPNKSYYILCSLLAIVPWKEPLYRTRWLRSRRPLKCIENCVVNK